MLFQRRRWLALCRLETLDRQLQDRKTSFSAFDTDVKEFLAWLTRAEVALTHYEEMAVTDLCTSEDQQSKSQRAFNVCILKRGEVFRDTDFRFFCPYPDISSRCKTTNLGLTLRAVSMFTLQFSLLHSRIPTDGWPG